MLILAFFYKNRINNLISEIMKEEVNLETVLSAEELINANYNYVKNGFSYEFSLLEFGSNSCVPCKQLIPVLEEIRNYDKIKVNVVFLNTMKPKNLTLMKYYAISAQPMIILLDKQGKEFFRNYGFISADDIILKIKEHSTKQS